MIGEYKTVTDYLIAQGAQFNPETVIINATDVVAADDGHLTHPEDRCLPPFEHVHLEFQVRQVAYLILVWRLLPGEITGLPYQSPQMYTYWSSSIHLESRSILISDRHGICVFNEDGTLDAEHLYLSGQITRFESYGWKAPDSMRLLPMNEEANIQMLIIANHCFACLHQKREVELVEYSRQVRRQVTRKTGKEPSPFFMLRVKPGAVIRQPVGGAGNPTGQKRAFHSVRGHFRTYEGHPFIPDHTVFVRAHTRGSLAHGETKKGYRIVP